MSKFTLPIFICFVGFFSGTLYASPEYPDRLDILTLLESKEFSELETMLHSAQLNYESGEGDEKQIAFILDTIANSNPEYETLFNEWQDSSPENYVIHLVKAYFYYSVAWLWRGHRKNEETGETRIKKMQDYLKLSTGELATAIQLKPILSAADALAIRILMMLDNDEYKEKTLSEALKLDEASYLVRASYLWSLKPEWGGDPVKLIKFSRKTSDDARKYTQLMPLKGYSDYIFAESLLEQRRYREAILHFDFAVDKGADDFIYRDRGINNFYLNRLDEALADFDRSLAIWPQNPRVLSWKPQTLTKMGNIDGAIEILELARRLAPFDRNVLMIYGHILRKEKQFEKILDIYEDALFYNREDADIWYARGMHYSHELVNFELAGRDLKLATELAPNRADYWYEYAAVLHYKLDCNIVKPLQSYLTLCESDVICNVGELKWARDADEWLKESGRCE